MEARQLNETNPALERLKEGNQRFVNGVQSLSPATNRKNLAELAEKGQKPFAVVLTCADSRVPAELIFDQGFGELFVIRVAGNVVQPSQVASIEYAVANLGVGLVAVVGHSKCGAVQAAVDCEASGSDPGSASLRELIELIMPAVTACKQDSAKASDLLTESIKENAKQVGALILETSPLLKDAQEKGNLSLVEGYFDMASGVVNFKDPT